MLYQFFFRLCVELSNPKNNLKEEILPWITQIILLRFQIGLHWIELGSIVLVFVFDCHSVIVAVDSTLIGSWRISISKGADWTFELFSAIHLSK